MIYGPIRESLKEYPSEGDIKMKTWRTLHEISHSLLEGVNSLVAKGALSKENRNEIQRYATCLNSSKPDEIDEVIQDMFHKSYIQF